MRRTDLLLALQIALCVALAVSQLACGGGHAAVTLPPPAIIVTISPAKATVQAGGTQAFTVAVSNDPSNKGVTWTISPSTGSGMLTGGTSTSVTYAAPASVASTLNVTITATSVADPSKFVSATATVPMQATGITVSLSPATSMLAPGSSMDITGTTNDPDGVTWSLSPASEAGTLGEEADQAGSLVALYTAPATISSTSLNVTVTATSVSDPTKSASVAVIVTVAIFVGISPVSAFIQVNGTVGFSASVTNDLNNAGVTWSVGGCAGAASVCGSITNATPSVANYVASATFPPGGKVSVIATSVTDPTKSATAVVTISPINFKSQNYSAGSSPNAIAVADFNGDGKLDVAVADYGNPSTGDNGGISVLLGNGDGTFQPAQLIGAGKNPLSIAAGDFNNDGKQDLVVTDLGDRSSGGNGNLTVLLGNGDGTFQSPVTLTAGPEPFELALGDFNNDGILDFTVTDFSTGVYLILGKGDGTFQSPVLFSTANSPVAIVAQDFNRDGKLDLAVAGSAPGGFSTTAHSTVAILPGNGGGSFAPAVPSPINTLGPTSIAAGDLNGDGKSDLAITTFICSFGLCTSGTSTLLGNGDGTFQPEQDVWLARCECGELTPLSIHIADLTGNGKADVVQIGFSNLAVLPGNGDGTFQGPLYFGADAAPFALATGDFNGDGKPDIVVANKDSNDVTVLLNATSP